MKKKILILCFCLLLLTSCGNVKLANGDNAVVTFNDNEGISVNELYQILKENYGINHLIDMIDTYLLEKEYDITEEETSYVNNVVLTIKEDSQKNNIDFNTYIKTNYGVNSESGFKDYIALNYRRNAWIESYVKENITDKQISDYYNNYTIGDIEASHILIVPENEEKEEDAYNLAKDIIKKLDNGETFDSLAKKYSDDEENADTGGSLGYFNRGAMDPNFEEEAINLEIGSYSSKPVKSSFGYHIIYKTNQKDKPSLEDAKNTIINAIAKETLENNTSIYVEAIKALREKYNMKIKDKKLSSNYNDLMNNLLK